MKNVFCSILSLLIFGSTLTSVGGAVPKQIACQRTDYPYHLQGVTTDGTIVMDPADLRKFAMKQGPTAVAPILSRETGYGSTVGMLVLDGKIWEARQKNFAKKGVSPQRWTACLVTSDLMPDYLESLTSYSRERLIELEAPVDRWVDAIPLGNGKSGALVWGTGDELRFTLDVADYWHIRRNPMLDDPEATWQKLASHTNDMKTLLKKYCVHQDPCKLPGVRLVAKLPKGFACKKFTLNAQEGFAEILLTGPKGPARLTAWLPDDSPYVSLALPEGFRFESLHFTTNAAFARLGGYPEPDITISSRGAFYRRGNRTGVSGPCVKDFTAGVQFVSARTKSESAFWKDFWCRSDVSIPDKCLQRFYDFAMYCFGAASRPGCAPIALQAVWTADNGDLPPWHGDYHMDLNVQESYWAAPVAGQLDALDAYAFHMTKLLPAFQDYGRTFFGMREGAAAIPGHMAYDGTFIAGGPLWALPLTHGLWAFAEVFNAWAYHPTKDRLERIWPLGVALAKGVDQVLLPPDETGVRRFAVSGSPELGTDGQFGESRIESFLTPNTTYDRSVTRGFLHQMARLAQARGSLAEERQFRALADSLGPALLDAKGRYLIAIGFALPNSHLHLSHLHDIFPYKEVDAGADALASVRQYLNCGKSSWYGHSMPEIACKCACVGLGDEAYACLRDFATAFTARNGFHLNYNYPTATATNRPPCEVFTLEANLAFARGLQEMLLGGDWDKVALFPALPKCWKGQEVSFRDWLVPGGHRISACRRADGTVTGSITPFEDATVELRFPDATARRMRLVRNRSVEFSSRAHGAVAH